MITYTCTCESRRDREGQEGGVGRDAQRLHLPLCGGERLDEMGGICKQREGTEFIIFRKCIHDQPCTSCLFPWQLVNSLELKWYM